MKNIYKIFRRWNKIFNQIHFFSLINTYEFVEKSLKGTEIIIFNDVFFILLIIL